MGFFRKAEVEFDLEHADGIVEKLMVVSRDLDAVATKLLHAASEARKASTDLNKASARARLTAQNQHNRH